MLKKELPPCPDPGTLSPSILLSKAPEPEGSKGTGKPVPTPAPTPFISPTPRLRSFTCSSPAEGRPAAGDKSQGKPKAPASSPVPVPAKRPIKPSRSELSQQAPPTPAQRPPLPLKSPAVLHLQHSKGRDYRENAELPHHSKHRPDDTPLSRTAMQVPWGACGGSCVCACVQHNCHDKEYMHMGSRACMCTYVAQPPCPGVCLDAQASGCACPHDTTTVPRSSVHVSSCACTCMCMI